MRLLNQIFNQGHVYGGLVGAAIVVKKRDAGWVGTVYGVLTLLTVAFLASWVGFFQEGLAKVGTYDNPFVDYLAKPLVLGVGGWFLARSTRRLMVWKQHQTQRRTAVME